MGQADDPLAAIQVLAAVAEDAGEPGCTAHEALEVHTEPAVPVAASEGLGQLVVEVEAYEEAALFIVFTVSTCGAAYFSVGGGHTYMGSVFLSPFSTEAEAHRDHLPFTWVLGI